MSKQRAVRRAQREQAQAAAAARLERRERSAARRRGARATVARTLPRRTRWRRQQGLLARRRRAQNATILGLFLVVQVVVWLVTGDPWLRATAALFGLMSLPVLVTLALDRRS